MRPAPGIPKLYPREIKRNRLLEQLRKAQDHSILALVAPSGYGKTTVLAQFARSSRRKVMWLTLDEGHQDPSVLAGDIALVLQSICTQSEMEFWQQSNAEHLTAEAQGTALARVLNGLEHNLYLILDRTEMLSKTSGQWLQRLHARVTEGHQFLLAGYESSALPFAQWLARGEALVWGPQELAFTPAESQEVMGKDQLKTSQVHEQLEGWPAGVALVASGAHLALDAADLIEERLLHLPAEHARHFHELAVLQVWTEKEARTLGCRLDAGWLNAAVHIGLPLSPLGRGKYRPHALLVEVLIQRFQATDPQRYQQLSEKLGDRLLKEGQELAATFCYLRAKNLVKGEPLIKRQIKLALAQLNIDLLLRLVDETLPLLTAPDEYYLCYKILALLDAGDLQAVKDILASHTFEASTDLYHQAMAYYEYRRGNFEKQLQLSVEGLEMARSDESRLQLYVYQGMALGALFRHEEKITVLYQALQLAFKENNAVSEARIYSMLGDAYGDLGKKPETVQAYGRAAEVFKKLGHSRRISEIYHNLACCHLDWGNPVEAMQLVQLASKENLDGFSLWEPLFLGLKCRSLLALNTDLEECIRDLNHAWRDAEQKGWAYHSYAFILLLSEAYARTGRFEQAEFWLDQGLMKIRALQHEEDEHKFRKMTLNLYREQKIVPELLDLSIDPTLLDRELAYRFALFQLEARRTTGQLTQADIEQLMLDFAALDTPHCFLTDLDLLKGLYQACTAQGWHADFFRTLLNPENLQETPVPLALVLKLEILGMFAASVHDQPLVLPLRKSQELLLLLALHGPQTRDQLIDALWSQGSEKDHLDYFKVAVRKLRTALKDIGLIDFDPILFKDGQYQLNKLLQVQLDAQPLLDLQHNGIQLHQLPALEKMLDTTILPQFDTEWLHLLRSRTHDLLVARLLQCATNHKHDLHVARSICEKILAAHPLEQQAYVLLLEVLAFHGLHHEIPRVSQLHQQRVKHVLN